MIQRTRTNKDITGEHDADVYAAIEELRLEDDAMNGLSDVS